MKYILKKDIELDKVYVGYNFIFQEDKYKDKDFIIICDVSQIGYLPNSVKSFKERIEDLIVYHIDEVTYNRIVVNNYCRFSNGVVASVIC